MASKIERVAVTGASGFVGSWLFRRLKSAAERGEVELFPLLGRREDGGHGPDICDAEAVSAEVAKVRPTAVIHLAAIAAPAEARADPRRAWDVNVMGTLNLAQAVRQHASEARFIYIGSSEAYGDSFTCAGEPLTEVAPLAPRSAYAATKAAADLMIGQMAADGLDCIRFRPFNHTGPGQSADYVTSAFARQIARIEKGLQPPVLQVGNLDAERDFLDVRDVVDGYIAAMRSKTALRPGLALNLATGRPIRIGAVLDALVAEANVPIEVSTDPARLRPNDIPRASGNFDLAEKLLGWRPRIPFEQTMRDVLNFWRLRESG